MRVRVLLLLCAAALLLVAGFVLAQTAQQRELSPRRLYFGGPPAAPHETGGDFRDCMVCHAEGGAGPQTPHPTRLNCRQCHVAAPEETPQFRANQLAGLRPPPRAPRIQPLAPPVIPHPVLLRENCLACHAPGARENIIATTHPERLRCQQCHIPQHPGVVPLGPRR